jgi:hypothetical protein
MIDIGGALDAAGDVVDAITGEEEEGPKVTKAVMSKNVSKYLDPDQQVFLCSMKGDQSTRKAMSEFVPTAVWAGAAALGLWKMDAGDIINTASNVLSMFQDADPEGARELRPICLDTLIKGEDACYCPTPTTVTAQVEERSQEVQAILETDTVPFLVLSGMDAAFLKMTVMLGDVFRKNGGIKGGIEEVRIKAIYAFLKIREYVGYSDDRDTPGSFNLFGFGSNNRDNDHYHWQNMSAIDGKMRERGISFDEFDFDEKFSISEFQSMASRCIGALSDVNLSDTFIQDALKNLFGKIEEVIGNLDLPFDIPLGDITGSFDFSAEAGDSDLMDYARQLGITPTAFDGAGSYFLDAIVKMAFSPFNMIGWIAKVLNWFLSMCEAIFTDKDFGTTYKTFPEPDLGNNDLGIMLSFIFCDLIFNWLLRPIGAVQFSDMDFSRIRTNFSNFFTAWAPPENDSNWDRLREEKGLLGAFFLYGTGIGSSESGDGPRLDEDASRLIFDFFMFMFLGYYCMRYLSTSTSVGGNFAGVGRTFAVWLVFTIFHNYIITGVYHEVAFNSLWISLFGIIFGISLFEIFKAIDQWAHIIVYALMAGIIALAWRALEWDDIIYTVLMGIVVMAYMASNIGEFGMMPLEDWNETDEAELSREDNYTGIIFKLSGGKEVHGIELTLERTTSDDSDFETKSYFIVDGYLPKNDAGEELRVPPGKYKIYFSKREKEGALKNPGDTDGPEIIKVHPAGNNTLVEELDVPETEADSETPFEIFLQWDNYVRIKAMKLGGHPDLAGICDHPDTYAPPIAYSTTPDADHIDIPIQNAQEGTRNHIVEEDDSHIFVVPGYNDGTNDLGVIEGNDADGNPHRYKLWGAIDPDNNANVSDDTWMHQYVVITVRDVRFDRSDNSAMFQEPVMMAKLRHKYDKSKVDQSPPSKAFLTGDVPIVRQSGQNCGAFSTSIVFNFWQPYKFNPWTSPDGKLSDRHGLTNSGGEYCDNHMPGEVFFAEARYPEGVTEYHADQGYQSKVMIGDKWDKSDALSKLKPYIAANIPVIVCVEELVGTIGSKHYKTIVGYDDDKEVKGIWVNDGDTVRIDNLKAEDLETQKGDFNLAAGMDAEVLKVDEGTWRVRIKVQNLDMDDNTQDTFQVKTSEVESADSADPGLAENKRVKIKQIDADGLARFPYDIEINMEGVLTSLTPHTIKLDNELHHKDGTQTQFIQAQETELELEAGGAGPFNVGDRIKIRGLEFNSLESYKYYVQIGQVGEVLAKSGTTYDLKMDDTLDRCFNAHPDELRSGGNTIVYDRKGVFYFNNTGATAELSSDLPDSHSQREFRDEDAWRNLPIGDDMDPYDTFWEKWKRGGVLEGWLGQMQDCTYIPSPINPP